MLASQHGGLTFLSDGWWSLGASHYPISLTRLLHSFAQLNYHLVFRRLPNSRLDLQDSIRVRLHGARQAAAFGAVSSGIARDMRGAVAGPYGVRVSGCCDGSWSRIALKRMLGWSNCTVLTSTLAVTEPLLLVRGERHLISLTFVRLCC